MAKLYNLARMTTATTGTGTITLGSAVSGYLTFALAGVANADVVDYGIKDGANSESGTGTYTTSGTTLTRTVTKSTNGNSAISLSGSAEVFISPRAETLNDASLLTTGNLDPARLSATTTAHGVALFEGASALLGNTGAGTAGQALISNGASTDPSFKSGVRVLLNTLTASSSATLSDTTSLTSAFNEYDIVFENIVPATNATMFQLQLHLAGGSFVSSSYLASTQSSGSSAWAFSNPTTYINCGYAAALMSNVSTNGLSGKITIYTPSSTTVYKSVVGQTQGIGSSGGQINNIIGGSYNGATTAVDGFQVLMSSGNITSGTIKIYGML